jgi:hypothetical protein
LGRLDEPDGSVVTARRVMLERADRRSIDGRILGSDPCRSRAPACESSAIMKPRTDLENRKTTGSTILLP